MLRLSALFPCALLLVLTPPCLARFCRVELVPHGTGFNSFSCNTCHTNGGGSPLNPFGLEVETRVRADNCEDRFWDEALALLDADSDGFSNGVELQDPEGLWRPGDAQPGNPALLSNPGDPDSTPPPQSPTPTPSATETAASTPTETDTPTWTPTPIPQDLNSSGKVNSEDLLMLLDRWRYGLPGADLNDDNETGYADLFFFSLEWEAEGWSGI